MLRRRVDISPLDRKPGNRERCRGRYRRTVRTQTQSIQYLLHGRQTGCHDLVGDVFVVRSCLYHEQRNSYLVFVLVLFQIFGDGGPDWGFWGCRRTLYCRLEERQLS